MITKKTPRTSDYHRLAPSVEKDWVEAFVLEQRLLGVSGAAIGDALAVVESHVGESGEPAQEVFGDATSYAREAATDRKSAGFEPGWAAGVVLGLLGMLVTLVGAQAWFVGEERVELTLGWAVGVLLLGLIGCGVLFLASDVVLRLVVERPWTAATAAAVYFVVVVALAVLLRQPLAELPVAAVVLVGVLLLAAGTALELREVVRGGVEDPILGPGEKAPRRKVSGFGVLTAFLMPLITLAMVGIAWVVTALG